MWAAVTGALVLVSACGGDGDGGTPPPENEAPVANFTPPSCTVNVPCNFTSTSTDDVAVTAWSWDFNGDAQPDATTANATYTFTTAGSPNVTLTVTDEEGLTNSKTSPVTVAPATPTNTAPTAGFTFSCTGVNCTFTNTSTDVAPGTIASYLWDFGDLTTSTEESPVHAYTATAPTAFTVNLTVTDNEGATDVETQTVNVTPVPPTAEDCTTAGTIVACDLEITSRSTVTITLTGVSCELGAQRVFIPAPIGPKQVFGNVCSRTAGEVYTLTDGTGAPAVLEAGTVLPIRFEQGDPDVGDPAVSAPAGTIDGTFGSWTISIDDGGNPTAPGEPDFTDVVLTVQATPAP
jgi:PKD repeat protein